MKKLPAQPVCGLIDGMGILQELAIRNGPVSGTELSKETGMELTRVNRLLKTLNYLGMADRTPDRRYRTGAGMHVLAAQSISSSRLLQVAARRLSKLERPGCLIALGVLWRDKVSYLFHKSHSASFLDAIGAHGVYPATKSSIGMALLAELNDDEIDALYKGRGTPGFKSLPSLKAELIRIRERGYAVLRHSPDDATIAARIGSPAMAAAAISGNIPPEQEEDLSLRLVAASLEISQGIALHDA